MYWTHRAMRGVSLYTLSGFGVFATLRDGCPSKQPDLNGLKETRRYSTSRRATAQHRPRHYLSTMHRRALVERCRQRLHNVPHAPCRVRLLRDKHHEAAPAGARQRYAVAISGHSIDEAGDLWEGQDEGRTSATHGQAKSGRIRHDGARMQIGFSVTPLKWWARGKQGPIHQSMDGTPL